MDKEYDLNNLKKAKQKIEEAMDLIKDVDNTDEEYQTLGDIFNNFGEIIADFENYLEEDLDIPNLERDLIMADIRYQDELDRKWEENGR